MQGDIVAIHDAAGNVVATYDYDAWGNILDISGAMGYINPIRYRGYYCDNETGFYYCQSRYYNPQWCRWISADVYCDTQDGILGTNMYAYCQNDPVNAVDPSGYATITFGKVYPLGRGYSARFDYGKVGNDNHVHIYNGKNEWVYKLDGSISHDSKTNGSGSGGPSNSIMKELKKQSGFDLKAKRAKYESNTENISGTQYFSAKVYNSYGEVIDTVLSSQTYFKDGSTLAEGILYFPDFVGPILMPTLQEAYSTYEYASPPFQGSTLSNAPNVFVPLPLPVPFPPFSFSFSFSPGFIPVFA